jgi:hypothetical protein
MRSRYCRAASVAGSHVRTPIIDSGRCESSTDVRALRSRTVSAAGLFSEQEREAINAELERLKSEPRPSSARRARSLPRTAGWQPVPSNVIGL